MTTGPDRRGAGARPGAATTRASSRGAGTPVPHRGMTTLLTLVVPLALMAAALVVALSWRDRLPDPVASHFGPGGVVDGTSSFWGMVSAIPMVGLPIAFIAWAIAFFVGHAAMTRRFAAGLAVWGAGFAGSLCLGLLQAQLDAAAATDAGDVDAAIAIAFVAPLALAALAAWAMPGDPVQPAAGPVPASAPRLELPDGETATWVRRVEWVSPVWIAVACVAFALVLGTTTRTWWFAAVMGAFLLALVGGLTSWTVSVDARGFVARSAFPRPRVVVPLAEVEHATVRTVSPLNEFGGWGLRTGLDGTVGLVLRSGEAIEVRRTGGRRVVATVDDAATGAALLNTLAERARA